MTGKQDSGGMNTRRQLQGFSGGPTDTFAAMRQSTTAEPSFRVTLPSGDDLEKGQRSTVSYATAKGAMLAPRDGIMVNRVSQQVVDAPLASDYMPSRSRSYGSYGIKRATTIDEEPLATASPEETPFSEMDSFVSSSVPPPPEIHFEEKQEQERQQSIPEETHDQQQ